MVLTNPTEHQNITHTLTGSEALTLTEVAATITAVRGTPVTFYDETIAEAYESRRKWNPSDWLLDAWVSTYTAIAAGELEQVTDHVARLTGRQPLTLRDLLT